MFHIPTSSPIITTMLGFWLVGFCGNCATAGAIVMTTAGSSVSRANHAFLNAFIISLPHGLTPLYGVDALMRNQSLIVALLLFPTTQQRVDRLHHRFLGIIFARCHNHLGVMLHLSQVKLGILA